MTLNPKIRPRALASLQAPLWRPVASDRASTDLGRVLRVAPGAPPPRAGGLNYRRGRPGRRVPDFSGSSRAGAVFHDSKGRALAERRVPAHLVQGAACGRAVSITDGLRPLGSSLYRTNRVRDRIQNFASNLHRRVSRLGRHQ